MIKQRRMHAYFASPLFNEMERRYNSELAQEIEKYLDVFLPQRDGGLLVREVNKGVPVDLAEQRIFEQDLTAIEKSNLLIAILDGAHIDEGVAFETGYAFALGKPCIGLQTDGRRTLPTGNNPMLGRSITVVCHSRSELIEWIAEFVSNDGTTARRRPVANGLLSANLAP